MQLCVLQGKASALLSELTKEVSEHEATQQKLEAALQAYTHDQQSWEEQRITLEASGGGGEQSMCANSATLEELDLCSSSPLSEAGLR